MKKFLNIVLCLAALSPLSVKADDCGCFDFCFDRPYVSVWGGGNAPANFDFHDQFNDRHDLNLGWYVGGAVGFHFSHNLRTDLSFDFINNKVEDTDHHLKQYVGLANLYYDFCSFDCFPCLTPFVGAGIGYAYLDLEDDNLNAFAFQIGGGLRYEINECWSASASYRLLGVTNGGTGYNNLFGVSLNRHF